MIKRFTDHAANERTYLAWVRTAIAIMAFGFLVEKFDIFIVTLSKTGGAAVTAADSPAAETVSLALFLIGILMMLASSFKFYIHKRNIESEELEDYGGKKTNLFLTVMLVAMSFFLLAYMAHEALKF